MSWIQIPSPQTNAASSNSLPLLFLFPTLPSPLSSFMFDYFCPVMLPSFLGSCRVRPPPLPHLPHPSPLRSPHSPATESPPLKHTHKLQPPSYNYRCVGGQYVTSLFCSHITLYCVCDSPMLTCGFNICQTPVTVRHLFEVLIPGMQIIDEFVIC